MREYKIIHLGEWDSRDIKGTKGKAKGKGLVKQSEQGYGFNRRIKMTDNFLELKDIEIQFTDLSKEGWVLDSINQVERNDIPKGQVISGRKSGDMNFLNLEKISYIAIFSRATNK
tara:strand:+ start:11 stop:355 length:345 start_codon:yes stop_codon:yes gene_type:complete